MNKLSYCNLTHWHRKKKKRSQVCSWSSLSEFCPAARRDKDITSREKNQSLMTLTEPAFSQHHLSKKAGLFLKWLNQRFGNKMLPWFYIQLLNLVLVATDNTTGDDKCLTGLPRSTHCFDARHERNKVTDSTAPPDNVSDTWFTLKPSLILTSTFYFDLFLPVRERPAFLDRPCCEKAGSSKVIQSFMLKTELLCTRYYMLHFLNTRVKGAVLLNKALMLMLHHILKEHECLASHQTWLLRS